MTQGTIRNTNTMAMNVTIQPVDRITPNDLRLEPSFGRAVVDALAYVESATARDVARMTGTSELIVRSVLESLAYVRYIDFDAETGRYRV